jgi:hypothetical protein
MTRREALLAGISLCAGTLAGCTARRPSTVAVHGRVTYHDRPLSRGTVTFVPLHPGPPATGQIQGDGQYALTTFRAGDGAVPGSYAVVVIAVPDLSGRLPDEPNLPAPLLIPRKYASHRTSELVFDVVAGDKPLDIRLD